MLKASKLAAEREARGVKLEEIQRSTNLGLHFLQAIEAEDFTQLPGGIYDVSYIRQYCKAVGREEASLLKRYYESRPAEEAPERRGLISSFVEQCTATLRRHHPA